MKPKILFTSICSPFNLALNEFEATDQMAFRLTRDQELFVMYEHTHLSALHLMAQNLNCESVVLEYPSLEQLETELGKGYDVVGISFKICNIQRLSEMCDMIRCQFPKTRIVIGGYGTICSSLLLEEEEWQGRFDGICEKEGIAFIQNYVGDFPSETIRCQLPKIGSTLPWLNPRPIGTIGIILSGLGCVYQCPFCTTSAYTKGSYIEVMNERQIFEAMVGYWKNTAFTNSVTIYDENFLEQKKKVEALGKLIYKDRNFGLKKLNYFAFGSLSALSRYDPDELLLYGLDTLWVGVESLNSPLAKTKGLKPDEAFSMLHSIGIKTVGSWIIGEDFQTTDNIVQDTDHFLSLDPTFQQLSILTVAPPLDLWKTLKAEGRIPEGIEWKDYHLYGKTFVPKNLTHQQMSDHLDHMYKSIYVKNGPAVMKVLEVNLNGYQYCRKSKHPKLREEKSHYFRNRCESYFPLLKTGREFAPSHQVRSRLDDLDKTYQQVFGKKSAALVNLENQILKKADTALKNGLHKLQTFRKEPFRRYHYPELSKRTGRKPYTVHYPDLEAGQLF